MAIETVSLAACLSDELDHRDRDLSLRPSPPTDDVFLALLDLQERRRAYARLALPEALLEKMSAAHLRAQTEAFVAENRAAEQLIICCKGEPVGRVWLAVDRRGGRRSLRLFDLLLREDVRGAGIGSNLLCSFVDSARMMRLERVTVAIFAANERAVDLCRRIGFRTQGVIDAAGNIEMAYTLSEP